MINRIQSKEAKKGARVTNIISFYFSVYLFVPYSQAPVPVAVLVQGGCCIVINVCVMPLSDNREQITRHNLRWIHYELGNLPATLWLTSTRPECINYSHSGEKRTYYVMEGSSAVFYSVFCTLSPLSQSHSLSVMLLYDVVASWATRDTSVTGGDGKYRYQQDFAKWAFKQAKLGPFSNWWEIWLAKLP